MAKIYYHAVPADWRKEQKYKFLDEDELCLKDRLDRDHARRETVSHSGPHRDAVESNGRTPTPTAHSLFLSLRIPCPRRLL